MGDCDGICLIAVVLLLLFWNWKGIRAFGSLCHFTDWGNRRLIVRFELGLQCPGVN